MSIKTYFNFNETIQFQPINCGNGFYNNKEGYCKCYPGWMTVREECDFPIGNNSHIDIETLNNYTSIYKGKEGLNLNIIFFILLINICLIFILRYYYNKYKKKYDQELEKHRERFEDNMFEKDKIAYEMNYINSSYFSFIPPFNASNLRSPNSNEKNGEKNNCKNEQKKEALENVKQKYIDLTNTNKKFKNEDEFNSEDENENKNEDDFYQV